MSVFFQTSRQRSFLSACRIARKKWSASVPLLLAALLTVVFYSCRDEDLTPSMLSFEQGGTRADAESTSGLDVAPNTTYGITYKPNCRVPLVGEGRVINQITKGLIAVGANNENQEFLIDKDLTNGVTVSGLTKVDAGIPIFSVRDINRVYYNDDEKQGVKVGFVYEPQGGVLDLSVLKSFYVQTLLNGKVQDSSLSESGGEFQFLDLNLLNVAGGKYEVSFDAKKPFDEVRLGYAGVNVNVSTAKSAKFYYAFVGENPEKIAAEGYTYTEAKGEEFENILEVGVWNSKKVLCDSDLDKGLIFSLSALVSAPKFRVNFNADIPAGSEIGFRTSTATLLNVDLGGVTMYALDESKKSQQEVKLGTGIGLSAVGGNSKNFSFITKEAARGVQIDFPLGVKLETTTIHYAYSRDPVEIDVSSYFTIGNDTISSDYYDLPTLSDGTVTYSLISYPEGATSPSISGNRITGMTVNGNYVVKAVYTREGETSWSYAVIYRNKKEAVAGCNMMMINTSGNEGQYTVVDPGILGGISLFNKINNTDKLVDKDAENYAEATNALSLFQFGGLIGVESTQDISKPNNGMTRVGFVMQTNKQLLGADVLKYFYIVLYKDGEVVDEGISQQNKTVGVGLIGNNGDKLRFYMETEKTFDRVELWTAGLLSVSLSTFRLYYAFYESTECDNNSATSEACMEVISAQNHGAKINYAETKLPSAVSVGSVMDNLSYVIDNSLKTSATIINGISLVDRTTIAVKFDYVNSGAVGAVLRSTPNILDVTALQNITVTAYNNGNAVTSEATSSGLVSIDLISDSGLAYLEINPKLGFDEVRISFPSLANALEAVWLSGFYIRPDANNNGIPDCAEEPADQGGTDGITYTSITEHVCVDETTYLGNVRISVDAKDDLLNTELTFTCYPYNGNGQKIEQKAKLDRDNNGYFFELSLPVGYYSISGLPYNGLRAQVHPRKTTWKRDPVDDNWNNWSNWTDGSPWGCTNVVIPTRATRYPVLKPWSSVDEFYGGNYCENIHFEPGAAVLNTQYLVYDRAYVEMEVTAGEYHMISTPLHGMVTGDMFVSSEMPAYFTQLDDKTYPEVRHNPLVRQKMYSRTVETATSGTNDPNSTIAATADWSRTFNAVAQPYEQAQGIMLMVGSEGDGTSYRLRFPKDYTTYNYYTLSGGKVKDEDLPGGARDKNGRFTYEESGFTPENVRNLFTFKLRNDKQGDKQGAIYFVAGNPFMSYLDIQKFLQQNSSSVSAICVLSEEEKLITITLDSKDGIRTIAPLQAFYVVSNNTNSTQLDITYTSDMFVQPSASTATRSSRSASVPTAGEMKISAVSGNSVSSCSLLRSAGASDSYSAKEDIVSLIDEDFMPKVKVYTVADKRALDIQKIKNAARVDLGFMVKDGSQQTEFTLDYGSNWKGWTLVDKQTGKRYLLDGTSLTVNAGAMKSNDGRFYLVKE